MAVSPQLPGHRLRVDALLTATRPLIAGSMQFPVMGRAQRHGELVRHLAAHGTRLQVGEVMGLGPVAATDQAGP